MQLPLPGSTAVAGLTIRDQALRIRASLDKLGVVVTIE